MTVLLAVVGIGAITVVSLLLGWGLLFLAGTGPFPHAHERAVASPRPSSAVRSPRNTNTLGGVERACTRRRRDPVSWPVAPARRGVPTVS